MKCKEILLTGLGALVAVLGPSATAWAATAVQVGSSGRTFASSAVECATDPASGVINATPKVDTGLFNPKRTDSADVSLGAEFITKVTATDPVATIWLTKGAGDYRVVVALGRKTADSYAFTVGPYTCSLPDTSGNWIGDDGMEHAASGKSYATVLPGCALSPTTGHPQPYVHLFDNGGFLLNVSVNGVPLTQLSALKSHAPVFLRAGLNVISAANGSLSTDYYIRDGGNGQCVLSP